MNLSQKHHLIVLFLFSFLITSCTSLSQITTFSSSQKNPELLDKQSKLTPVSNTNQLKSHSTSSNTISYNYSTGNYQIDRSTLNSPEWQKAIAIIKQRPNIRNNRGTKITLVRVFWEDAKANETVQFVGTKLNDLKPTSTGGGRFQQVPNGGFFVVEHINSQRRKNNRDPLEIGAYFHVRPTIWIDVPSEQLGLLGDLRLSWAPKNQRGNLKIKVKGKPNIKLTKITIGPAIVGGPYGRDFLFEANSELTINNITAGTYKLLFPEFNYQKSRWTVYIEPGRTTELNFVAHSQTDLKKLP